MLQPPILGVGGQKIKSQDDSLTKSRNNKNDQIFFYNKQKHEKT